MISARAVGEARLQFAINKFPILRDVYFIPCFKRNLIYVSRLNDQLFNVSFDNEVVSISKNGLNICYGYLDNGPYFFRPISKPLLNIEMFKVANQRVRSKRFLIKMIHTYGTFYLVI